jgi:hypothetical protein
MFAHATSITWDDLENRVSNIWKQFEVEKFELYHGDPKSIAETNGADGVKIDTSNFREYIRNDQVITVLSKCKGFSHFSDEDARSYANVRLVNDCTSDEEFLDYDGEISDALVNHVVDDLCYRLMVFDLSSISENTMREFISSILMLTVLVANGANRDVSMVVEKSVKGTMGNGPVDWVLIFKNYCICMAEAKKENIFGGLFQNLAQIVAGREMYAATVLCKRPREVDCIDNVASSGVVTTAKEWILTRYVMKSGQWMFYKHNALPLTLTPGTPDKARMKSEVIAIVKKLVGMIIFQKEELQKLSGDVMPPSKISKK